MEEINIRPASISLMKHITDIIFQAQRNDLLLLAEKIQLISGKSIKSIKNGLYMLQKLKVIKNNPIIFLNKTIFNKLNEDYSVEKVIFDRIMLFPLFIEYLYLLNTNKKDFEAALFLRHIFNIKSSENIIKTTFNGWKKYYKISLQTKMNPNISNKEIISKSEALLNIRNYFQNNLSNIPEIVICDLVEGIFNAKLNPDSSLTDTGRALENYLRLNFNDKINLKKCNGIGQISQKLRQNRLINSKHNNILLALGSIRTIGDAHGIDKEEMIKWEISKDTAMIYNTLTIKAIKSLEAYKKGLLSF